MLPRIFFCFCVILPVQAVLSQNKAGADPKSSIESTVELTDSFSTNWHYLLPNHAGFLSGKSKIKGGDFAGDSVRFTVGIIDYDGDGIFNEVDKDRVFLTTYRNRYISVNNGYGAHCEVLKDTNLVFRVDSNYFRLTEVDPRGTFLKLTPISKPAPTRDLLHLATRFPDVTLETYHGKPLAVGDFLHQGKLLYFFFWATRAMPITIEKVAPLDALEEIALYYQKKVQVIGLHTRFADTYTEDNPHFFFGMLGEPWKQAICPRDLYLDLSQDLTYFRGVLTDENGAILETSITPQDLLNRIKGD